MKKISKSVLSVFTSVGIMAMLPLGMVAHAENKTAFVLSVEDESVELGDDITIKLSSSGAPVASGKLCVQYRNDVLAYQSYELPMSSAIAEGEFQVSSVDDGVSYVLFAIEDVANVDILLNFKAVAYGETSVELIVEQLFNASAEEVEYVIDYTENWNAPTSWDQSISVENQQITEPITTTTQTTTTSTETTTTEATTTSAETTTTEVTTTSAETTTTEATTTFTETTTTEATTTSTETTTTEATTTSTSNNTTASAKTSTTKSSTTKPSINNNPSTGDKFPVIALLLAAGIAGGSLVIAYPRKRDEKK